jgi:dipeptidase
MREIYEWDTGRRLGQIPQPPHTYRVVGNINEHQVVIGETTFGGRAELVDPEGLIDYGSLMYIALERSTTARQAIDVMTSLVAEYGYCSSGESFSIADENEVWLLEMVGKGPGGKGAVWVARRVPDGHITAHANQARIGRFPQHEPHNTLFAPDVMSFARARGYFNGEDSAFSFRDAYAPLDFSSLRIAEARVWSAFRRLAPSLELDPAWVMGDVTAEPLPLWIRPDEKVSLREVMLAMRDHFEASAMDLHEDVGAGPFGLPYRWRPLFWELDGVKYFNERAISTQQTGFSFVSQSRRGFPDTIGGILWFGVDDTNMTVYVPMYAGIHAAPDPFAVGTGDFNTFTWDSAFWTFNFVSNLAYSRYRDMIVDVRTVQSELEGEFIARSGEVDRTALKLWGEAPGLARDYLTRVSTQAAERTHERFRHLGEQLLVKYLDGNVRNEHGIVTHPPYPEAWYRRIVEDTGDRYRYKKLPGEIGYYTSREELGTRAENVPDSFDFGSQKLWLLPGTAKCGQQPRCCLEPIAGANGLTVEIHRPVPTPAERRERRRCGEAGLLVKVPVAEKRDVIPKFVVPSETP